jgi:hypothetical protein
VHEHGAVGRDGADEPAPQQVYEDGRHPRLDDVAADAPDDGLALLACGADAGREFAQAAPGQNVRQRVQEIRDGGPFAHGPGEILDGDFARARR